MLHPSNQDRLPERRLAVEFDERSIEAIFSELDQCHLAGAAVGIAVDGQPLFRKGFGLANMELPVVLSPTIRMRIASLSKHFTALAFMLLCEEGKVGLDDTLGHHLPELHPVTRRVTLRQLMGNISGLRDAHDIMTTFSGFGRRVSIEERWSFYRSIDDVNAPPGITWSYNNGGWLLMSVIIERISRQPLEQFLSSRLFHPIGMYQTVLRRVDTDFLANSACSHRADGCGSFEKREQFNLFAMPVAGEGGIVSTIDDMLRWMAHMESPFIGTRSTWAAITTPLQLANGSSTGYGLGLGVGRYRGVEILHHAGGGTGSNAYMIKVPALRLDVVVMANRNDVSSAVLAHQILDRAIRGLDPTAVASTDATSSTGTFRSAKTHRIIELKSSASVPWVRQGRQALSIDGMEMDAEVASDGVLKVSGFSESTQTISLIGERALPSGLRFNDFGAVDELVRVEAPSNPGLGALEGRYSSEPTGTEVVISRIDGTPTLHTHGRFGTASYALQCLTEGVWQARSPVVTFKGGILSLDEDERGFHFSTLSTRALPFRRVG
jgi:CubicO group peptidase (beta-lactamase class C family)